MSQIRCFHGNAECRACGIEPAWTAKDERAAVVAWLRSTTIGRLWGQDPLDAAADAIERGEHRKEEES